METRICSPFSTEQPKRRTWFWWLTEEIEEFDFVPDLIDAADFMCRLCRKRQFQGVFWRRNR
ncbi:hypothetical protein U1Q18_030091 [Sarracenia purpurea var. burkii]